MVANGNPFCPHGVSWGTYCVYGCNKPIGFFQPIRESFTFMNNDIVVSSIKTQEEIAHVQGDAKERKEQPLFSGVLAYFPDALLEVAKVSKVGNDQHNPGHSLHWAKEKSRDEADSLLRHLIDHGKFDSDGQRHSAKVAWRALALLQRELEMEQGYDFNPETDKWEKVR